MKHVLITGVSGFIGDFTVKEFIREGWYVIALIHRTLSSELEELSENGNVTLVRGDITLFDDLKIAVEKTLKERDASLDAIVHCAGRASDVGRRSVFRRTNFKSVQHLVQLCRSLDVPRFVFVSTTDVYGLRDFQGECEDELPLVNNRKNPYPEYKIAAENWIRQELPSERFAIVRPAAVWGNGDPTLTPRIVDFLRWSPWIVHFGSWHGRNRWPLAHVRNVASALYLAATLSETSGEVINVLDSEFTTIDEYYKILVGIYFPDKKLKSITLPLWTGKIAGSFISCISNILNLKHPFMDPSLYAVYSVSSNLDFSNRRFQQLMSDSGHTLVTREEGICELRNEIVKE